MRKPEIFFVNICLLFVGHFDQKFLMSGLSTNMFSVGADGRVTHDGSRFTGLVEASLLRAWDFEELRPEARVAALLLPDLISSSLAPTTRYSYELHYSKIFVWC